MCRGECSTEAKGSHLLWPWHSLDGRKRMYLSGAVALQFRGCPEDLQQRGTTIYWHVSLKGGRYPAASALPWGMKNPGFSFPYNLLSGQ